MTDILEKYNNLLNEISVIKSVASELADTIGRNNEAIKWYRQYMAEQFETNPDYDCSFDNREIVLLEKQNAIIEEMERSLWASHIGKPYGL